MVLDLVDFITEGGYDLILSDEQDLYVCPICDTEFCLDDNLEWINERILVCPGCEVGLRIR